MQEAGADAVLELAFTVADGLQYINTGDSPFFFFAVYRYGCYCLHNLLINLKFLISWKQLVGTCIPGLC